MAKRVLEIDVDSAVIKAAEVTRKGRSDAV